MMRLLCLSVALVCLCASPGLAQAPGACERLRTIALPNASVTLAQEVNY